METMRDFDRLTIVGAGASGREIAWLAREVHGDGLAIEFAVEAEYLDARLEAGIPVRPLDASLVSPHNRYVIAIGDSMARKRVEGVCARLGLLPTTLVHPRVERSQAIELAPGCIVAAGCVLTTNIRLGRHVHVNIGCTVSHDAVLEDFVTLSPGVHVAGHVHIHEAAFLGTGANVVNGTRSQPLVIGREAVVAAGACVTQPVDPAAMVAGVPAVRKR